MILKIPFVAELSKTHPFRAKVKGKVEKEKRKRFNNEKLWPGRILMPRWPIAAKCYWLGLIASGGGGGNLRQGAIPGQGKDDRKSINLMSMSRGVDVREFLVRPWPGGGTRKGRHPV